MSAPASSIAIVMRGIALDVRIGEHPWERHPERPSRLELDITLHFAFADYFGAHGGYVDYDPLRNFLKALQDKPHVDRLEDFARTILAACFEMTPAARVELSVMKPDIFPVRRGVGLRFVVARADLL
jgi:dihydroneopterin aldolase